MMLRTATVGLAVAAFAAAAPGMAQQQEPQLPSQQPHDIEQLPAAPRAQNLVQATLIDAQGQVLGTAAFVETPNGLLIQLELDGIPPGVHGLHIHEQGACEPPDFQSAGGHFDPTAAQHGYLSEDGYHAGDLPNLYVEEDGRARVDIFTRDVTLGTGPRSLFPPGGTALVLHAGNDDYFTDPAGDSGARIACGRITRQTRP